MHTFPLAFDRWAALYDSGCPPRYDTNSSKFRPSAGPAELKCRSRMHYYLADLAASKQDPYRCRAILLNRGGYVTETATANVLAYRPRRRADFRHRALDNSARHQLVMVVRELSQSLSIPCVERDLSIDDLLAADEVLLTSTPNCLLPVVRVNDTPIGDGRPGNAFCSLLGAVEQCGGRRNCAPGEEVPPSERQLRSRTMCVPVRWQHTGCAHFNVAVCILQCWCVSRFNQRRLS